MLVDLVHAFGSLVLRVCQGDSDKVARRCAAISLGQIVIEVPSERVS